MDKYIEIYKNMREKLRAYRYAMWVLGWDLETEAPLGSHQYRAKQVEILTKEIYNLETNKDYLKSIDELYLHQNEIPKLLKIEINRVYKNLRLIKKMPKDRYIEFRVLVENASMIWAKARKEDDYLSYLPTLEKIIEFTKEIVKYLETDGLKGYNVLLDMYEEGMTSDKYDAFFNKLRTELVPFVLGATSRKLPFSRKLTKGKFPIQKQKEFSEYLLDVFKYDRNRGLLKTSNHPFTSNVFTDDVRITTRYNENSLEFSIFSTIHEMGHGIYEMQINPKLNETRLNGGASMGIHESQSRMFENMLGKSYAFWEVHYEKLQAVFKKELKNVSLIDFYQYINRAERSLIRTEADELTYPLHIMVRYEIEKELIDGKLKAKDLPKRWRKLYAEYIGIRPKNDADGVLQDIHWSGGAFGYFPTYALGSAYAAQIYQAMNKDFNIENAISNNEINKVNDWLKEKIHQYGQTKKPDELLLNATGEAFNPDYYIDYLKRKFAS